MTRRGFLLTSSVAAAATTTEKPLPQMHLGKHSFSRLVCGSNMFAGGSHLSGFLNKRLQAYYTEDQVVKTLRRCAEVGIDCFQGIPRFIPAFRRVDLPMKFLALHYGDDSGTRDLAKAGCVGIAHHGEFTDRLFKAGRIDEVKDYLSRVRDAGMLAGVSTHMPAVVDTIESKGWAVDYYMTCVYERHRSAEDLKKLLGQVPLPVGEVYLQEDPPRMYRMIQQTKRPCLAFKILAAGRLSDRPGAVEAAFRDTFAAIKPGDGVIVGMYDEYSDQAAENAAFARKYGA